MCSATSLLDCRVATAVTVATTTVAMDRQTLATLNVVDKWRVTCVGAPWPLVCGGSLQGTASAMDPTGLGQDVTGAVWATLVHYALQTAQLPQQPPPPQFP